MEEHSAKESTPRRQSLTVADQVFAAVRNEMQRNNLPNIWFRWRREVTETGAAFEIIGRLSWQPDGTLSFSGVSIDYSIDPTGDAIVATKETPNKLLDAILPYESSGSRLNPISFAFTDQEQAPVGGLGVFRPNQE
jgi:hypothetical protein